MNIATYLPPAPPLPVARSAIGALGLALLLGGDAVTCVGMLALLGVGIAAVERRTGAMLALAGIAAAAGAFGIAALPVAIGIGIAQRAAWRLAWCPVAALVAVALLGAWPAPVPPAGLWAFAPADDSLFALFCATAIGAGAWFAADLSWRRLAGPALVRSMFVAYAGGVLFLPTPVAALALPVVLAVLLRDPRLLALTGTAALLARVSSFGATLALTIAVALAIRPLLRRPANDNGAMRVLRPA